MSLTFEPATSRSAVPDNVWRATKALLDTTPPTNPNVLLNAAEWWYNNGRGGNDPAFRYAIRWLDYSTNDNIAVGGKGDDLDLYAELRDYLKDLDEHDGATH